VWVCVDASMQSVAPPAACVHGASHISCVRACAHIPTLTQTHQTHAHAQLVPVYTSTTNEHARTHILTRAHTCTHTHISGICGSSGI